MKKKVDKNLMGKIVTIKTKLWKDPMDGKQKRLEIKPIAGWVVGYRTVYDTKVEYDYEEGNHAINTNAKFCMLVCTYPTKKPIHVPYGEYELGGEIGKLYKWTEEDKKSAKEFYKDLNLDRDSNGRFV